MSQSDDRLVAGATNSVTHKGLKDEDSGLYLVDATVTLTGLYDANGDLVAGAGAIDMPYVPTTTGRNTLYRGWIPHTVPLIVGDTYTRKVTVVAADTSVRVFETDLVAERG